MTSHISCSMRMRPTLQLSRNVPPRLANTRIGVHNWTIVCFAQRIYYVFKWVSFWWQNWFHHMKCMHVYPSNFGSVPFSRIHRLGDDMFHDSGQGILIYYDISCWLSIYKCRAQWVRFRGIRFFISRNDVELSSGGRGDTDLPISVFIKKFMDFTVCLHRQDRYPSDTSTSPHKW